MRDWDNSRAPMIGDRRVGLGCAIVSLVCFFGGIALVLGLIKWMGEWIGFGI